MSLLALGLSHRTAPLAVRERLRIAEAAYVSVLRRLRELPGVREVLLLSTCHRTEVYIASDDPDTTSAAVEAALAPGGDLPRPFTTHGYRYQDRDAVRHLFGVAAGLDSVALGETQIVGQVRSAYRAAVEAGAAGPTLQRLLDHALRIAKRVRNETTLGALALSIPAVAVELTRKVFADLAEKTIVVVGAGEMAELTLDYLRRAGASRLIVTNRDVDRARVVSDRFGGETRPLLALPDLLESADVVITSTGSSVPIITRAMIETALARRRHRALLLVDLAVPRNVEPSVKSLPNTFAYDIDALQDVVRANGALVGRELDRARALTVKEAEAFWNWLEERKAQPAIVKLRRWAEEIRKGELARAQAALRALAPEEMVIVDAMTRALINKILHGPLVALRATSREDHSARSLAEILDLFGFASQTERR